MNSPLLVTFAGGSTGRWRVLEIDTVAGASLPAVGRVEVYEGAVAPERPDATWILRGVAGQVRYVNRAEKDALAAVQAGLGRREATRAAPIPIKKSAAWWNLAQDERRAIFEERSKHIEQSLKYLPAVAGAYTTRGTWGSRSTF